MSCECDKYLHSSFVIDFRGRKFVTGGNDLDSEGSWRWAGSGKEFQFTRWYKGEPNNAGGNEDCLYLDPSISYLWNDRDCITKAVAVCEKKMN